MQDVINMQACKFSKIIKVVRDVIYMQACIPLKSSYCAGPLVYDREHEIANL